ncbi:hypothetical protein Tco_0176379 [Tanacetum coccineum]
MRVYPLSHVSFHMAPRGDMWTPPSCHVVTVDPLTCPLTGGQPPLTGSPTVVDQWSGDGMAGLRYYSSVRGLDVGWDPSQSLKILEWGTWHILSGGSKE